MNKTIRLIIVIGFVVLSSCGNDDDSYMLPEVGNECRVSSKITKGFDKIDEYKYRYDTRGRIILEEHSRNNSEPFEYWEYIYNGRKIQVNYYYKGEDGFYLVPSSSRKVFLNSNGSIQRRQNKYDTTLNYDGNSANNENTISITLNHEFKYDNAGYLVEDIETYRYYAIVSGEHWDTFEIRRNRTIVDGNVTEEKEVYYDFNGEVIREETTINTFNDFSFNLYSGGLYDGTPNKNMVEETQFYEDGALSSHKRFTYDFDDKSNVTEISRENVLSDSGNVFRTFYEWDCGQQ